MSPDTLEKIKETIVVLVDSREKNNFHIVSRLQSQGINWKPATLDFCDYSFILPQNKKLGIEADIDFRRIFAIERKACLDEIASNLTKYRERFKKEFIKSHESGCHVCLLIENGSFQEIRDHRYRSMMHENAFEQSLIKWSQKFDLDLQFISKKKSCSLILTKFYEAIEVFFGFKEADSLIKNCQKCGSFSLEERTKDIPPPHTCGVYCCDCGAWCKWGKLSKQKSKEELKMFEVNHEEAYQGSSLMPEGEYEVIVKKAEETTTKSGIEHICLNVVVRNDIDQKFKNKNLWHRMWKSKETGEYNMKMFQTLCKAFTFPTGTKFESMADMLNNFDGRTALVTIKHDTYQDKTSERISGWNTSKYPVCAHVFKDKTSTENTMLETSDGCPWE